MAGELIYALAACAGRNNQTQETESNQAPKSECVDQNGLSATFTDSFSLTGPKSMDGTIQTLFPVSGQGLWAVNLHQGTWDEGKKNPSLFQLGQVDQSGFESVLDLPDSDNRWYGRSTAQGNLIAMPYTSAQAEGDNGVVVYNIETGEYTDFNLTESDGLTGAAVVMFDSQGRLLVLNNNIHGDLSFEEPSTLAIIEDPTDDESSINTIDLPGILNAQGMQFIDGGTLAIFGTGDLVEPDKKVSVMHVNLISREIEYETSFEQTGLGMNGVLPVMQDGALVLTGVDREGRVIAFYNPEEGQLTSYSQTLSSQIDTDNPYEWPYLSDVSLISNVQGNPTAFYSLKETGSNGPVYSVYASSLENEPTLLGHVGNDLFAVSTYDPETNLACVAGNQSIGTADLMCWSVQEVVCE